MEHRPNSEGRSIRVHLDAELLAELESWRKRQHLIPSRAAAVRRCIALAVANDAQAA
jgi:hypothetical protein